MYLMHKDEPVLYISWENGSAQKMEILSGQFLPYRLKGRLKAEKEEDTPEQKFDVWTNNWIALNDFLASRVVTLSRSNMKTMFNYLKLSQADNPIERTKISVICKSASMTDCYWIKDDSSAKTWKDMNLRDVPLDKVIEIIALHGKITATGNARTPDVPNPEISTYGTSGMAWKREGNDTYLYKKNARYGNDAQIEIEVSNILDCFNIPHAKYEKAADDHDNRMCKSKNIAGNGLEIVTAEDVMIFCQNNDKDFWEIMRTKRFAEDVGKAIVTDYLISNIDRHEQNWGFYVSEKTGNIIACHPLIDHNHAFDENMMNDPDMPCRMTESMENNCSARDMAKRWLKISGVKCLKPVVRELFLNDSHYESFMERASELGLYREMKPEGLWTVLRKFGKSSKDYEPVKITGSKEASMTDYNKRLLADEMLFKQKQTEKATENVVYNEVKPANLFR